MAYRKGTGKNVASIESYGLGNASGGGAGDEFYELEPAVVLDVVLDETHPIFQNPSNLQTNIDVARWPSDFQGNLPVQGELDFTWIGRVLVRMLFSSPAVPKEKLIWAYPLEYGVSEYPLINEVVMISQYGSKLFYSRKLNTKNFPNQSADFGVNKTVSGQQNTELYSDTPYQGPLSETRHNGGVGYEGVAGKYYKINNRIRSVKRHEGDLVIESRFGQSLIFGAYDDNRINDKGDDNLVDYKDGGGNPMIILRNRQRKILKEGETLELSPSPNPATIKGTKEEKNAGGFIKANINHDGSSLYITTGQTISKWVTTCYKKMFGMGEEVAAFEGTTNFVWPELSGDQIVINSDRLIFSSRYGETFHFSKKRYGVVTDSEYTVDAHDQIVMTTHVKTVFNSPAIYLGEYDQTSEPVLLGQTSVNWMYEFCNLFIEHTHWHIHSHKDAGKETPSQTQALVQLQRAIALRDNLHTLLSRRVFVVGGGFAPGQNGADI